MIEYITDNGFSVRYTAPSRKYGTLREEFEKDALAISKKYGNVYLGFSSGVDSQIILKSFIDQKLEVTPVFMHAVSYNDLEFERVKQCEDFYKTKIHIHNVYIDNYKEQWLNNSSDAMVFYPIRVMVEELTEPWPIIMQGAVEPSIVRNSKMVPVIYHNKNEGMIARHNLLSTIRPVLDFPYSPEAVASYYTDPSLKLFCQTLNYYYTQGIADSDILNLYNAHAKAFVKGQYYQNEILWFEKLSGFEQYPDWVLEPIYDKNNRILVPYNELVSFLETTDGATKTFNKVH